MMASVPYTSEKGLSPVDPLGVVLYACQGFCFDPFSEIVNGYQEELPLASSQGKRAYNVHPPLHEGAGGQHGSKGFCWLMYERGMLLASLALAY
ncbi:UNVERIFIED_CONTAM: hypothetical protein Slati_1524200 [Sesamum latifolium]|uniref:Uncharacterized protein n=1 Tax=Sesamum latifolium TaxID=2727402 RepID=A0AAW2X7B0_9LAMI